MKKQKIIRHILYIAGIILIPFCVILLFSNCEAGRNLGFYDDGEHFFATFSNRGCYVWNTENLSVKSVYSHPASLLYAGVSKDGGHIAVFSDKSFRLFSTKSKTQIKHGICCPYRWFNETNISFDPDGRYLNIGENIYDIANKSYAIKQNGRVGGIHPARLLSLKESVDDCWLISSKPDDMGEYRELILINHKNDKIVRSIKLMEKPGYSFCLTGGTKVFQLFKDEIFIADFYTLSVKIFNVSEINLYGDVFPFSVSADGRLYCIFNSNEAAVYSADTGKILKVFKCEINEIIKLTAINNKKRMLAMACDVQGNFFTQHIAIKIFDLNSGKLIKRINKNRWYLDS